MLRLGLPSVRKWQSFPIWEVLSNQSEDPTIHVTKRHFLRLLGYLLGLLYIPFPGHEALPKEILFIYYPGRSDFSRCPKHDQTARQVKYFASVCFFIFRMKCFV